MGSFSSDVSIGFWITGGDFSRFDFVLVGGCTGGGGGVGGGDVGFLTGASFIGGGVSGAVSLGLLIVFFFSSEVDLVLLVGGFTFSSEADLVLLFVGFTFLDFSLSFIGKDLVASETFFFALVVTFFTLDEIAFLSFFVFFGFLVSFDGIKLF